MLCVATLTRMLTVAVKQVGVSDLSGRQASEEQFAKLTVHQHPHIAVLVAELRLPRVLRTPAHEAVVTEGGPHHVGELGAVDAR